jgi:hypothetical protein
VPDRPPMQTISTEKEWTAVLNAPCAVLFIDVIWSRSARASRGVVSKLVEGWRESGMFSSVSFYRVDLSDQEGTLWTEISRWLSPQSAPEVSLTYGGNGALVWIRDGVAVDYLSHAAGEKIEALLGRTRRALAASSPPERE